MTVRVPRMPAALYKAMPGLSGADRLQPTVCGVCLTEIRKRAPHVAAHRAERHAAPPEVRRSN
jgi:hypothetical protein